MWTPGLGAVWSVNVRRWLTSCRSSGSLRLQPSVATRLTCVRPADVHPAQPQKKKHITGRTHYVSWAEPTLWNTFTPNYTFGKRDFVLGNVYIVLPWEIYISSLDFRAPSLFIVVIIINYWGRWNHLWLELWLLFRVHGLKIKWWKSFNSKTPKEKLFFKT